jgi:phosphatidylserine/phosphatidylglycerophosphate/cardiolipin synthase-like enzyme
MPSISERRVVPASGSAGAQAANRNNPIVIQAIRFILLMYHIHPNPAICCKMLLETPSGGRMRSILSRLANNLIILTFLFSACTAPPTATSPTPTLSQEEVTDGEWYSVYFSDPGGPNSDSQRGGPDLYLAEAIDQARASVDIALYDLNLWSIRDALVSAHRRGVAVRVVAESDNLDRPEFQDLIAAGIPVLGDRHEALMHHKFAIIDHYEVWTGSMNLTLNGAYHTNNNLIWIRSTRLAKDYQTEFDEMFVDDLFGDASPANTPYPS